MKALVVAFNQEIVRHKIREGSFRALFSNHVCVQLLAVLTVLGGRTHASEAKAAKEMEIEKDLNMKLFPDRS